MVPKTTRLDLLIVERGLVPSRQVAQTAIMDGGVIVDGQKVTKPGNPTKPDARIELVGDWQGSRYVSRGGLKLERALQELKIDVTGRICLDLGASTGGFTDCLLKHGATKVYAIDVGYGQLDWTLRNDERVVVKERTNARNLMPTELYEPDAPCATIGVADLSFISLTKVLPAAVALLQPGDATMIALIKPQFEAGREAVGKGGVVREKSTHLAVIGEVLEFAAGIGLSCIGLTYSPLKGPAGNIEFLAAWKNFGAAQNIDLAAIVDEAHARLNAEKNQP